MDHTNTLIDKKLEKLIEFYGGSDITFNLEILKNEFKLFSKYILEYKVEFDRKNIPNEENNVEQSSFDESLDHLSADLNNRKIFFKQLNQAKLDFFDVNNLLNLIIKKSLENTFPNIYNLLNLVITLPLTSNTAERSLSQLRLLLKLFKFHYEK